MDEQQDCSIKIVQCSHLERVSEAVDDQACSAGGSQGFLACAALYAVGNACCGASPMAYATDVMPDKLGGFGLGMYRCAGDLGETYFCLPYMLGSHSFAAYWQTHHLTA